MLVSLSKLVSTSSFPLVLFLKASFHVQSTAILTSENLKSSFIIFFLFSYAELASFLSNVGNARTFENDVVC